ncbi:MAG TPA: glucose 1-dehydrogenase [Beijerinckiaceae bacterium]|jgi:NAD(P)-dependent dehydrogenase (short-subunit alcohol dehydrogenase family)
MRLENKVAIVTGGSSGIGFASAQRLVAEGAKVAIASLTKDKVEASAAKLGADVLGLACDVGREAEVIAAVDATVERFGRLDIIVNNAGMMVFKPLWELEDADWRRVLEVDLLGAVHFTKQAFLRMGQGGAIVNVASVHAVMTSPLVAPYAAAKAAMLSLTRSAGIEGREKGIRANVVLPGAIDTPMLWDNPNIKSGAEKIDPKDVGRPEDVAAAVAFLASDDAAFITGSALRVDGGRLDRL